MFIKKQIQINRNTKQKINLKLKRLLFRQTRKQSKKFNIAKFTFMLNETNMIENSTKQKTKRETKSKIKTTI